MASASFRNPRPDDHGHRQRRRKRQRERSHSAAPSAVSRPARAFNTDALVQKVFVSLYPATIPADATLHLEVTNNPFDTSPVWVDITDKANRLVHVFTNTTATKGYGLGYRFYITKGTQEIEITQATIRFA